MPGHWANKHIAFLSHMAPLKDGYYLLSPFYR